MAIQRRHYSRPELDQLWDGLRSKFALEKAIWVYDYCYNWGVPEWYAVERYEYRHRDAP